MKAKAYVSIGIVLIKSHCMTEQHILFMGSDGMVLYGIMTWKISNDSAEHMVLLGEELY